MPLSNHVPETALNCLNAVATLHLEGTITMQPIFWGHGILQIQADIL